MLTHHRYWQSLQSTRFVAFWQRQSRLRLLCILLGLATAYDIVLAVLAPPPDSGTAGFVTLWLIGFLPYLLACTVVLTRQAPDGRQRWLELGVIMGGALLLRSILLPIPPDLSHDSWRYLWDARVTLNGFSPYVYAPENQVLGHLQDFLYANSRFRNVPSIYPPGAQAFYILSYLIAPENLFVLKGLFTLCELLSCGLLAYLLYKKGSDPARCIIYAWCPLPIVEFAIQGHLDVLTIMFTLLTLVCAQGNWRGARVCTGFCLALATLTKLYPILMVVAVLRRKDWALLVTCAATIVLAYVPYLILGHGQVLGFFSSYADEFTPNAGLTQHLVHWLSAQIPMTHQLVQWLTYALDLLIIGEGLLFIFILRWKSNLSMEAATLILFGLIFSVSSHIFPWYTTALLPFVALLIEPFRPRNQEKQPQARARMIALLTTWYFCVMSITGYYYGRDWSLYYVLAYDLTLVGLGWAIAVAANSKKVSATDSTENLASKQRDKEVNGSSADNGELSSAAFETQRLRG
jgi:hypothetical protein